jgi:hypothetical protein
MLYTKITPSFIIGPEELSVVEEMYPYSSCAYCELEPEVKVFLMSEQDSIPEGTKVIAVSKHVGRGHFWGVILIQYPFWTDEWRVFAQHGHYDRTNFLFPKNLSPSHYLEFLESGKLPPPPNPYCQLKSPEILLVKDVLSSNQARL